MSYTVLSWGAAMFPGTKQLKAAGITSNKWTLLTISVTEDEMLGHWR